MSSPLPGLPARGSTDWYAWATAIHNAVRDLQQASTTPTTPTTGGFGDSFGTAFGGSA